MGEMTKRARMIDYLLINGWKTDYNAYIWWHPKLSGKITYGLESAYTFEWDENFRRLCLEIEKIA